MVAVKLQKYQNTCLVGNYHPERQVFISQNNRQMSIVIYDWMIKLKLSKNSLLAFAIIYGVSWDSYHKFRGTKEYICKCLDIKLDELEIILNELCYLKLINIGCDSDGDYLCANIEFINKL